MAWILMEKEGKTFRAGGVSCWAFSHGDMETRGESGELWAEVFYTIALECGSRRVEIDCIAQVSAEDGRLHWNWDAIEEADLTVFEDDEETSEDGSEVYKQFAQKMGGWQVENMLTRMATDSLLEEMEEDATELLHEAETDAQCFIDPEQIPYFTRPDFGRFDDECVNCRVYC